MDASTAHAPRLRTATPADRDVVVTTAVAAFERDPVVRYLFPGEEYPASAGAFFGALYDARVRLGTVWVADDGAGVAMWSPPHRSDLDRDVEEAAMSRMRAAVGPEACARMDSYHGALHSLLPPAPRWYLGVLAVHPDAAGTGLGTALIAHGLADDHRAGATPTLETATARNVAYYESRGWRLVSQTTDPVPFWILVHGDALDD